MKIGCKEFDISSNQSYVMGILNITPDSFSDGGKYINRDHALRQAEQMIKDGVDIIDVGGESTRPGYTKISNSEEIARITPIIEALKELCDVPISVDTYKWEVAQAALQSGANMINDIWGLDYYEDPEHHMAKIVANANVPVCIMHNRVNGVNSSSRKEFTDILVNDLKNRLKIAEENGISPDHIMLDPGVGFAKTFHENMWCMSSIKDIKALGYPVLLGISNKSLIGNITGTPATERKEGTIALNVLGRQYGCCFFRVHDVKGNRQALDVTDRILCE